MLSYDIFAYARMLRDTVRNAAYAEALRLCVTPDSVVLDLGAGLGIWSLLACQFGARKVYAIDANDAIQIAREIAAVNGFANRIEFIQAFSTKVTLPEKADILVSDMHGIIPMFEQNIPSIIDARKRLLRPGATIIPQQDSLWVAPVEAPQSWTHVVKPWADKPHGFDWAPALKVATNSWFMVKDKLTTAAMFAEPERWATLDYRVLDNPNIHGEVNFTAVRDGCCHGLLTWFDMHLVEGLDISNAPDRPETIFGQAFFPWSQPVNISPGDTISVSIRCDLLSTFHLWRWNTTVANADLVKADFRQSTFFEMPLSPAALRNRRGNHIPTLNKDGEIQRFVLSLMDGSNTVEDIARQTTAQFPDGFADPGEARSKVADISQNYSV